jgi:glycosyltransferase involved in cell wall biosynthesis
MKLLSIGMDKDLLKKDSVSFRRHKEYAKKMDEMHAVVFAKKDFGDDVVKISQNAWAYPTNSSNVFMLFYDAFSLGKKILSENKKNDGDGNANNDWVISAQDPFESGVVAFVLHKVTGIPFLLQEHGDFFSEPYWKRESFLNRIRFQVGLFLLKKANHVRVVSERIKKTLMKMGVDENKITITPVYTEIDSFVKALPDENLSKLRPNDGVLFVTIARLVPQKNLVLLIDSFIEVLESGVKARLVIFGKGECEEELRDFARSAPEGSILFKEWTDNPAGTIKAADVFALSSNYEGWGRVCIEALATETVLLMTDVGCAGEVVVDGENGFVVPVNDKWAFSKGISFLAENMDKIGERITENGVNTVKNLPSFEENVKKYISGLQKCLTDAH